MDIPVHTHFCKKYINSASDIQSALEVGRDLCIDQKPDHFPQELAGIIKLHNPWKRHDF